MNWKTVFKPTLVLFAVCLVVTAALSVTNYFTKDAIAAAAEKAIRESMESLIPGAAFTSLSADADDAYLAEKDGQTAGYIFLTRATGYKSKIQVMTGLDPAGRVIGVRIVDCSDESPGIGQKVGTDEAFLQQFAGQYNTTDALDAITGATYSSRAVREAVNEALDLFQTAAGGDAQ